MIKSNNYVIVAADSKIWSLDTRVQATNTACKIGFAANKYAIALEGIDFKHSGIARTKHALESAGSKANIESIASSVLTYEATQISLVEKYSPHSLTSLPDEERGLNLFIAWIDSDGHPQILWGRLILDIDSNDAVTPKQDLTFLPSEKPVSVQTIGFGHNVAEEIKANSTARGKVAQAQINQYLKDTSVNNMEKMAVWYEGLVADWYPLKVERPVDVALITSAGLDKTHIKSGCR